MGLFEYQLSRMLDKLASVESMADSVAGVVGEELEAFVGATIRDTKDPDSGRAWKLNLTGEKSLKTAVKSLNLTIRDGVVLMTLPYYLAMHNNGTATGKIQRRILPSKITRELAVRIKSRLSREFARLV